MTSLLSVSKMSGISIVFLVLVLINFMSNLNGLIQNDEENEGPNGWTDKDDSQKKKCVITIGLGSQPVSCTILPRHRHARYITRYQLDKCS